jgi:hypothetical protein
VTSQELDLPSGSDSYTALGGANWEATCPSGYTAIGTGFDAGGVGTVGFVESYGTFVGGFISNDSQVDDDPVYLEAICAYVAGGSTGIPGASPDLASRSTEQARYRADLRAMTSTSRAANVR